MAGFAARGAALLAWLMSPLLQVLAWHASCATAVLGDGDQATSAPESMPEIPRPLGWG